MEKYLDAIEYSVNEKMWKLEARMKSFASTAQRICLDEDFTPYNLDNSIYTAIKRLKSFTKESVYFEDLVICLNDSERIYTSSGVVDMNTFINKTCRPSEGFSEADFLELLHSKKYYDGTKEGQYVTTGVFQYSIMTYPLGRLSGSYYGTLVGLYRSDWEEIFQTEIAERDRRLVIVCTNAMDMIYTQMPDGVREGLNQQSDLTEPLAHVLRDWDRETKYYEFCLNGVDYIGKIAHSDIDGCYLIDMVDKSSISRELILLQMPMLGVTFISLLLLTIFLSIVLSVYNYAPIQKLYDMIGKKGKRQKESGKNELLFLNEYIRELIKEQNSMGEQLDISRKISRMELVRRLLRCTVDVTSPAVKSHMDDVGLQLDKRFLAAIVVKTLTNEEKDFGPRLRSILYESKYSGFYLTERIYKDYDAFLACVENEEEVEEFSEWLIEQMGGCMRIGIGNLYSGMESLRYSLMEAVIAVEGKENSVVFFSNLATRRNDEFFRKPLENELKLKQLLVSGAAENLDEVLDRLHKELLHIQLAGSERALHFVLDRIFSLLFEDALSLSEGEKYLHYTDLDSFFDQIREFCCVELNSRLEQKASQENKRMQEILHFIDENYMRQDMSLAMVAETFDMTGPYLSRIFKLAIGRNFIDYIAEKRMNLAARLLVDTDAAIGEIVGMVGYSDAASFTRKFTRHFLMSPGSYRKKESEKRKEFQKCRNI